MAYSVITPTQLASSELTTSMATYRTVPVGTRDIVTTMTIANNNSTAKRFSVHFVNDGDSADNSNAIFPDVTIDGNSSITWRGNHVLDSEATIQSVASDTGITLIASGGNAV